MKKNILLFGLVMILLSGLAHAEFDNGTLFYNWESGAGNLPNIWGANDGIVTSMIFGSSVPTFAISGTGGSWAGEFDGTNDQVITTNDVIFNTGESFSFSMWKNASDTQADGMAFGTTKNNGGYTAGYLFLEEKWSPADACTGFAVFRFEDDTSGTNVVFCQTDVNIYDGLYHSEVIIYNHTTDDCDWYVDGVSRAMTFLFGSCNLAANNINAGGTNGKITLGRRDSSDALYNKMNIDNFMVFTDRAITQTEVENLNDYGTLTAPATGLFIFNLTDFYDSSNIHNFTVQIGNGTFIENKTSNSSDGAVHWNVSNIVNITVFAITGSEGVYFNRTYENIDTNMFVLTGEVWQSILITNATEKITGIDLGDFNATVIGQGLTKFNTSNSSNLTNHLLNSAGYNITGRANGRLYNATAEVTLANVEIRKLTLEFGDVRLRLFAEDEITGIPITTFNITATVNGSSYTESRSTSNGSIDLILINSSRGYDYNITMRTPSQSSSFVILSNVTEPTQNYTFKAFQLESVLINIFDQETGDPILENISIQFINNIAGFTNFTTTGGFFIANLTPDTYTVWFDGVNYTKTAYFITVTIGSNQTLNVYLPPVNFTNTVTMEFIDKDAGSKLENVSVAISRIVGTSQTQINVLRTDVTGLIEFNFETFVEYCFVATLTGYEIKSFCLSPILKSEYTVNMKRDAEALTTIDYYNILVLYNPSRFVEGLNNFSIQFISPDSDMNSYSWFLEYKGANIASGSGANANGQIFQVTNFNIVNPNIENSITLNYTYDSALSGTKSYRFLLEISVTPDINNTIMSIRTRSKTYGLSIFERSMIVALIAILIGGMTFFVIGFSATGIMVLVVYGMAMYLQFLDFWAGIITMISIFIFWVWGST